MEDVFSHDLKFSLEVGNRVGKLILEITKGLTLSDNPLKLFGDPSGDRTRVTGVRVGHLYITY